MLGAHPRELAAMPTLAMLAGDWPTAAAAARARLRRRPEDEGALVALGVALWELGCEEEARAALAPGSAVRARAAVRFHHYLDDPAGAEAALARAGGVARDLALGVAECWRRHGEFDRAEAIAGALLARDPADAAAAALRRGAHGERAAASGAWAPRTGPVGLRPHPGRVLHLLERSLPQWQSGSTLRSARTVAAQAGAGLSPEIVTQPGFGAPGVELVDGIPHHRLARRTGMGAPLDERLRDHLEGAAAVVERVRPAVLHAASDYLNALVALELGRRYRLPVVYEVRGFPELARGRWGASRVPQEKALWRTRLEADCRQAADRVVTLAGVMRDHIVAEGADPERVVVVPNAVDVERFAPAAPDSALRASLGLPVGELVLGYASLLYVMEGLPTLLDAAARLVARGLPVRVLLVGDGLERPYLRALARRLGIADRVVLTGRVPHEQVRAHLSLIDVFVVPRLDVDDFSLVTPLKPYEAMASGTPVVASRVPALQEVLDGGRAGALFEPGDAEDLARVVAELAADPGGRRALAERARAWVAADRSWAGNARRYRRLYEELGAL